MSGRIRTVKPELLEDAITGGLSDSAFRVFIGMILLADDYGNLRAEHKFLDGQIYWSATPQQSVSVSCEELETLVSFYSVRGQLYGHINGWEKHQKVQHLGKPRVPSIAEKDSPYSSETLQKVSGVSQENLSPDLRPHTSDQDQDQDQDRPSSGLGEDQATLIGVVRKRTGTTSKLAKVKFTPEARAVVEHWACATYHGRRPLVTDDRCKLVQRKLDGGYSVDDLKHAVDGAERDDWLMGRKDGSPGYRGIETILGKDDRIDRLIGLSAVAESGDLNESLRAIEATKAALAARAEPTAEVANGSG